MTSTSSPSREESRARLDAVKAASERLQRLREEMRPMLEQIEDPRDPIFDELPDRLEHCQTDREEILHRRRAALVLKEQYSQAPFHAQRAKELGEQHWHDLASSAVNVLPGPSTGKPKRPSMVKGVKRLPGS